MRSVLASLCLVVVLVCLPLTVQTTQATATACLPQLSWGNYFNGIGVSAGDSVFVEAQATLEGQNIGLCGPGSYSGTGVWVALVARPPYDIVQIGMWRTPWAYGGQMRYFYAAGRMATSEMTEISPGVHDLGPADLSRSHPFRVRVVETDWTGARFDRVQFYIDGAMVATVPLVEFPWVRHATSAHFYGESWNKGDSIGGNVSNPFTFSKARVRVQGGLSVAAFRGWIGYAELRGHWRLRITSSTSLNIWTVWGDVLNQQPLVGR